MPFDYAAAAMAFFKVVHGFMKKLPDYDQKKLNDFSKKIRTYEIELTRNIAERDDDLILTLRDELTSYVEVFTETLSRLTNE